MPVAYSIAIVFATARPFEAVSVFAWRSESAVTLVGAWRGFT